jgi:hypothetical protein
VFQMWLYKYYAALPLCIGPKGTEQLYLPACRYLQ